MSKSRNRVLKLIRQYDGTDNVLRSMPIAEFRQLKSIEQKLLLDECWSYLVKLRAGFRCEISGADTGLNSHHIIGKDTLRIRWEIDNGIAITSGIHSFDAHGTRVRQMRFEEKVKRLRGSDIYDRLFALRDGKVLNKVSMFLYFREKYKELQEN